MNFKLLTNGHYIETTGLFYPQQGQEKYYIVLKTYKKSNIIVYRLMTLGILWRNIDYVFIVIIKLILYYI
ncbi:MAG: hypothetical protein ACTMUB_02010 [cyanobacterium endosymbiont of Rhopalodia musculus]|uniref:hypothetical protein n=1 Tax=cyanobacterium endosymbiont of Epithemia clementina EcSB TaxID=3034674 RepID=UPI00247FAEBB|nr:hypothetical protein [cyanobacterium endosymbiont of Epithemia clementina EcSB]WGT67010.1 hypothetical protein P3F56_07190 [cyanobacterium endosymbiont of Epithemia clementina EcSB]